MKDRRKDSSDFQLLLLEIGLPDMDGYRSEQLEMLLRKAVALSR